MVFLYDENAGIPQLDIVAQQFLHLKARRANQGDRIDVRNLKDGFNYIYEISLLNRKNATLELVLKHSLPAQVHQIKIIWAVVEGSVVEKTLPLLNEMGLGKVIFVYCEFSQKNIKLDLARLERILINSSQQCGRNSVLELEIFDNIDELLQRYDNIALVDFGGKNLEKRGNELLFIGPEGGFSSSERDKFKNSYSLKSQYILRSNSAILGVASKILL